MKHIPILKQEFEGAEINSVNSRELHNNLEIKTAHSHWIKRLIEKYEFVEGEDYLTIVKKDSRKTMTDFILSLDMAKEVCMVSNTDKGRETRKYFLKIEKQGNAELLDSLSSHINKTKALFNTQEVMGEVVTEHDKRISNLEKNVRLENWQEKALQDAKNKKVYAIAGDDKALANKLHRKVWQLFKKRFNLPRYSELRVSQYENGLEYIYNLTMSDMI